MLYIKFNLVDVSLNLLYPPGTLSGSLTHCSCFFIFATYLLRILGHCFWSISPSSGFADSRLKTFMFFVRVISLIRFRFNWFLAKTHYKRYCVLPSEGATCVAGSLLGIFVTDDHYYNFFFIHYVEYFYREKSIIIINLFIFAYYPEVQFM